MAKKIAVVPGDGIGPEVAGAAVRAVDATGLDICWRRAELNEAIILESGKTLPAYLLDSLNETRVGLKGPVTTPVACGFQSVNVALRKTLDLFANVRPVRSLPCIQTRFQDVAIDMVIFRENPENASPGLGVEAKTPEADRLALFLRDEMGWQIRPDSGIGIKPISETGSKRLVRAATRNAPPPGARRASLPSRGKRTEQH